MKRCLTFFAAVCALASCIGTKELKVTSNPDGAEVVINGVKKPGVTPMTLEVKQDKDLGIVVSKPGYQSAAKTLFTRTNFWLSLLWTNTDPRSQYIAEDEVDFTLEKIPTPSTYRPSAMEDYTGGGGYTTPKPPALRPMPQELSTKDE